MSTIDDLDLGKYKLGWSDDVEYVFKPKRGLTTEIVEEMSWMKGEPDWMRKFRLRALDVFRRKPMPSWGGDMSEIFFDDIYYYIKPTSGQVDSWDALPESVRQTYEKLGIPEAEQKYLAGVTAQYECLRGDTRVWTTEGMKRIKELAPGDIVFSLDESAKGFVPGVVMGMRSSGVKETFEVVAGGRRIVASGNHPFLSLRDRRLPGRQKARYRAEWTAVDELSVGDLVAVAADAPEYGRSIRLELPERDGGERLPEFTNPDLCWFLGLYLGDGYLHHRGSYTSVEIAVDPTDTVLIAEIQRVAAEQFGIEFTLASDGLRLIGPRTAALADYLELNGLAGTAHTKRYPWWVQAMPKAERLAFLAGHIDADGYVRKHRTSKNPVLSSANESLLNDAKELAALCGITSSRITTQRNRHPHDPGRIVIGHQLHLSGQFDRLPVRSPRRIERLGQRSYAHRSNSANGTTIRSHTSDELGYARISQIASVGAEEVFDIEVAGHHNFIAEGFVVHNSEVVFHRNREDLEQLGVIFCDMDTAVREYPDIVKQYFSTVIPTADNKFSALNSAVWSGGSFIYVPPGVEVPMPLQAYFRINQENMGQFERTLIIADKGAKVHYVEGCSAPVYTSDSLHSAVVELVALEGSHITYSTIQNWSNNVFNLVTKRARAEAESRVSWIDGNIGSRLTMKYPAIYLMGPKAVGEVLSVAYAGAGQHQDTGAKMVHAAPETTSTVISKSISKDGGRTSYRGLVRVEEGAENVKSHVQCDALILDDESRSDTYPYIERNPGVNNAQIGHEATVSKVGDDQLFYLMARGLSREQATAMVVNGFMEPVTRTLPMEFAVEWSRLVELQMEGSIG
jgi:FeS assembly protein SufB